MVNCVALTYVAACATVLYVTVEVVRKFVPFRVSVCAAAPTFTDEGDRLVSVGGGTNPVPVSGMARVLGVALSVTVNVPLRIPVVVGVNVTLIWQFAPAASVEGEMGHGGLPGA